MLLSFIGGTRKEWKRERENKTHRRQLRLEEPQIQCSQWNVSNSSHPSAGSHWTRRGWGNRTREDIEEAVKKRKILPLQNGPCWPWRISSRTGVEERREGYRSGWRIWGFVFRENITFNLGRGIRPALDGQHYTTKPNGVARPTSIDSALFLCPFPARIESLVAWSASITRFCVCRPFSPLFLSFL